MAGNSTCTLGHVQCIRPGGSFWKLFNALCAMEARVKLIGFLVGRIGVEQLALGTSIVNCWGRGCPS